MISGPGYGTETPGVRIKEDNLVKLMNVFVLLTVWIIENSILSWRRTTL